MRHELFAVALTAAVFTSAPGHAAGVGSPAPAVEPTEWLNVTGTISWAALKGRLVLVEKWATW